MSRPRRSIFRGPTTGPSIRKIRGAAGRGGQVRDALHAAHRRGTVQGEASPANMPTARAGAMRTDVGLAAMEDSAALTMTGQMVGSPAYRPTERINGDTAPPPADLWA